MAKYAKFTSEWRELICEYYGIDKSKTKTHLLAAFYAEMYCPDTRRGKLSFVEQFAADCNQAIELIDNKYPELLQAFQDRPRPKLTL